MEGAGVAAAATGAKATPRKTSPAAAVFRITNCSPEAAAAASVMLASTSVIETNWLGSAPWSPLALTVEVTANRVTVPLLFIRPVRFRRPPAAGYRAEGYPLTA